MVGGWEISNADRDRRCPLAFSVDPAPGGYKVELDAECATAFPSLADVVAWDFGPKDVLRLLDAKGAALLEFTEVESGMFESERGADGLLFLQTQASLKIETRTAEQMVGDWDLLREADKPLCRITLSDAAGGERPSASSSSRAATRRSPLSGSRPGGSTATSSCSPAAAAPGGSPKATPPPGSACRSASIRCCWCGSERIDLRCRGFLTVARTEDQETTMRLTGNSGVRRSALALAARRRRGAAETAADFYKGKTVSLIAGFPPGGGYDTYVRVLARHYGRFLPGQPTVVASNMPGAGSLTAANNIYAKYAPDGLALAMFASSAAMEPLIGNKAALFDATKFSWVGSMSQDVAYCGVWQHPGGATTFDEMLTKETIIGGGAPAAITYQHPMVLKNVLKANFKVIQGYKGTRDINIAMQRGEVNGTCGMFGSSVKAQFGAEVKDGRMKLFIQMGSKRSDEFGKIPSVFDYAKTDEDRAILQFHFGQLLLGRPLAGPPGIPADRLEALRDALFATMKDPQFLAEATKAGLDIDPVSPDEVDEAAQAVRRLLAGDTGEGEGRHGAVIRPLSHPPPSSGAK